MTLIVASLSTNDLARETHLAMKRKLTGLTLSNGQGTEETVPVTYNRPEEWMGMRKAPSVNIAMISSSFDPIRFTTAKLKSYKTSEKTIVLQKGYPIPVNYIYEIRFITSYGQHSISLRDQILRRFPPFGFGTFITIPFGSGQVMCPFEQIDERDLFDRYGETEDNREFEHVFRYKVESWLDLYETVEVKTAMGIVLDVRVDVELV